MKLVLEGKKAPNGYTEPLDRFRCCYGMETSLYE